MGNLVKNLTLSGTLLTRCPCRYGTLSPATVTPLTAPSPDGDWWCKRGASCHRKKKIY